MTELAQKLLDVASTTEGIIALCVALAVSVLVKNPSVSPLLKDWLSKLVTPKSPEVPKTPVELSIETTEPDLIGHYSELVRSAVDSGDTEQLEALNLYIQRQAKIQSATPEDW